MGGIYEGLEMFLRGGASGTIKERQLGMRISAREVRFDGDSMWVTLDDGQALGVPLAWFPRLVGASPAEREAVEIGASGLHRVRRARRTVPGTARWGGRGRWEALDEDMSVEGLLNGRGDCTEQMPKMT